MTALIYAADNNHIEAVELLLAKDADVNIKDNGGYTALMWAARRYHAKVVNLLKQAGAKE